jgi:hypothetical protein
MKGNGKSYSRKNLNTSVGPNTYALAIEIHKKDYTGQRTTQFTQLHNTSQKTAK